jgi:hypothetical protein
MLADTRIPDASAIAEEAFVLAYPLVLNSRSMAKATAVLAPEPATMRAPVNAFVHGRDTPDTLRSSGWLDLAEEPIVLSVPDTCGRYYAVWLRDAWDAVFASVGARTSGTVPGTFAVIGPAGRAVAIPAGMTPIAAPTRMVHVTGCIEAICATDDEALIRAREGFELVPLSRWCGERPTSTAPLITAEHRLSAVEQVDQMSAQEFFAEVADLIADNPPDAAGRSALDRLHELSTSDAAPELQTIVERGVARGREAIRVEAERPPDETVGRWRVLDGLRRPGADRLRRAAAARADRSGEPASDALHALLDCDDDGRPLLGRYQYVLRFPPGAAPPALGFWSLTTSGASPHSAHSTGDLRGLMIDRDGSLPIYLQHRPPARERRSNWLPTPPDGFSVALHLYWPREEALERRWAPPPVQRVAQTAVAGDPAR